MWLLVLTGGATLTEIRDSLGMNPIDVLLALHELTKQGFVCASRVRGRGIVYESR